MESPEKLRAQGTGKASELTKLKRLWRDTFPEATREYWRSQFASDVSQADLRSELKLKHDVNLLWDSQLTDFRTWEFQQRLRELEAEQMAEDERRLQETHGEWSLDEIRAEVLRKSYTRSIATGDFKQALATVDRDQTERSMKFKGELETRKLDLSERRVVLLEENAASAKAKLTTLASKGGISPEVLAQIEEAARLL